MLEDEKSAKSKQKRTLYHIATFIDGYAAGWKMAVPEDFRDALDIKMTDKMIDGRKNKVWTQGFNFDFHEGDLLYDTPLAYSHWSKANIKVIIQVQASPVKNEMAFEVRQPNYSTDKHIIECKQSEFVGMLQSGLLTTPKRQIDFFTKIKRE